MNKQLVPCTEEHWEFVRRLRTDPRTMHGFIQQGAITPAQQHRYMSAHWHQYYIAFLGNEPAGFVGNVEGDIRVCTHPDFQRKGVAAFMIGELMTRFPEASARIKIENEPARKLFEKCGFSPSFVVYKKPPTLE
jgi:GNAT superfamily N-acetyltransferase